MTLDFPPTLAAAARAVAARRTTPTELVELCLARIERHNPHLRAFLLVRAADARAEARAATDEIARGLLRGPLHGIPLALKDAIDTAGVRTTYGSRVFADRVPSADAELVVRLKRAGAIILGKTECHELCLGGPAMDAFAPPARNPWNNELYAGGSSSGSGVAVAAGLCLGAIGTDTGGSIRIPAAINGIAGHKPTYGLVSNHGIVPLAQSLDHPGPMARTSEDCALLLAAIMGADPKDRATLGVSAREPVLPTAPRLDGVRIGVVRHFSDGPDLGTTEVNDSLDAAVRALVGLGAATRAIRLPDLWDYTTCNSAIMSSEAFANNAAWLRDTPEKVSGFTRGRMMLGAFVRAEDYIKAQRMRRALIRATRDAMDGVDAIVCAGQLAPPAPVVGMQKFYYLKRPLITAPFNLTGMPALGVCSGFTADGLPLGIQIAARPRDDALALRIGHAYEHATRWFERTPKLD
ncbi:MAG: amidase [Alphaproteobacteria bacterium]|nr:amidase [Alphaproteobacteria bacterium]